MKIVVWTGNRSIVTRLFLFGCCCILPLRAQPSVSLNVYGLEADGQRVSNVRIVREEIERTLLLPLLPYVFFEKGSSIIPSRYVQYTPEEAALYDFREFSMLSSSGMRSTISAYYNIMNVIGRRLVRSPGSTIVIQGGTAHDEDQSLGDQRARAVLQYLETRFPETRGQLRIGAPVRSLNRETDSRLADENRCVSFIGGWDIVKPLVVRDTTVTVTPSKLDFVIQSSVDNINEVQLLAWQQDAERPLFSYYDVELPPAPVRWHLGDDVEHQPTTEDKLSAQLTIVSHEFKRYLSDIVQVPVDQFNLYRKKSGKVTNGKEIHQYNLILFDRNSSELRPDHIRIVDSVIADDGYVLPTSRVRVLGYADSTGTAEINTKLSQSRAQSAAERMLVTYSDVITEANIDEVRGIGSVDVLKLPDGQATPESRFYSRTVFIILENRPSW